jgi:hypothetical protein
MLALVEVLALAAGPAAAARSALSLRAIGMNRVALPAPSQGAVQPCHQKRASLEFSSRSGALMRYLLIPVAATGLSLCGTMAARAEFQIQEADIEKGEVELEYRGAYHWGCPSSHQCQ